MGAPRLDAETWENFKANIRPPANVNLPYCTSACCCVAFRKRTMAGRCGSLLRHCCEWAFSAAIAFTLHRGVVPILQPAVVVHHLHAVVSVRDRELRCERGDTDLLAAGIEHRDDLEPR
jgi:hypothetical protein